MDNKILYRYASNYREKGGLTKKGKILSIFYMWLMVSISFHFRLDNITAKCAIILIALVGTFVMGFIVPTAKK